MPRSIACIIVVLGLTATLAWADPQIRVDYNSGVPQVRLDGDYSGSRYAVLRAPGHDGAFAAIKNAGTPCTGMCYADDYDAQPGASYWYRFDLELSDGALVSFGPYPVTISTELARRVRATVMPNPSATQTRIQLFLAGRPEDPPLEATATLYDLQGREVQVLHHGPLYRGTTRVEWDGRDANGRTVRAGLYYLRFATPIGVGITKVFRIH